MVSQKEFTKYIQKAEIGDMGGDIVGCVLTSEMINPLFRDKLKPFFDSLSQDITGYASKTHSEMLPKEAFELEDTFFAGNSAIFFAADEQNEVIPVGHASCVPLYATDNLRVYEFGGWYVKDEYRHHRLNGMTIGETVGLSAIEQTQLNCQHDEVQPVIIATVKRQNSLKGLQHLGFIVDSFHKRPYTTALTCSCATSSEHFGCNACLHRRGPENGEKHSIGMGGIGYEFVPITIPNGTDVKKIPCSLLVHESSAIDTFEERMMESFEGGQYEGVITNTIMRQMGNQLQKDGNIV
ncbi:hypothetical protein A2334_01450 [Candidatus Roizmanbacteria bacterium RIFOXYB2_FULL_38_10]|uniref:Uncharacterized protein n=1 Tax=Candidatus Roizmanbacteria bacterium RIFOXYD1_FULL_38_12 TaxID=1802093 RepID=A0A1F7L260_9BACT|nr:MAG: hypothetical protein A3K47_05610 [Candidatus Roizmanbacteria bacterium RIFOXYA2_FULL_38_14]OGK64220.1 MAG: hypothetical protein A3K27_05610 [Candidatus Roizmanbacteria bacterium RIFOXYA1_FULL_37_12]OGK66066.1 MAG: hypothetical protein A3K38_05610 [Candidatus Roizmanbacteria bacterium RIFOXYB1_FULL_40_23]OGK68515.1 MAG: hypothetical protein A2334_01450 [Candidatus Roizmanbacteria bacterium RIFOXYB2_FULL_38_10]OGK70471.1 MAG: hypothetical protein A3K21_05615 [Candidatus Roizmanbacteria ba